MSIGVSAIGQGLLYGLIGLGLFLTFRVLDFPDMTVEGTFPFGAAVAVSAITHGICGDACWIGNWVVDHER